MGQGGVTVGGGGCRHRPRNSIPKHQGDARFLKISKRLFIVEYQFRRKGAIKKDCEHRAFIKGDCLLIDRSFRTYPYYILDVHILAHNTLWLDL